ncbi:MAG: NADH-quinone oxidoreductase subunit N [bacterium]
MISTFATIDVAFKALAPRNADWASILPEICVAGLSLLCLVQAMFLPKTLKSLIPVTARIGLCLVIAMACVANRAWNPAQGPVTTFAGLLQVTDLTMGFRLTFLISALLTSFLATRFLTERDAVIADYHHVLLVVTAAFMLLVQSHHFVTLFVSLETAAVGLYILVGYLRRSEASLEAGVKYLVAGGLSSALLLMGIVLVYGSLGAPGVDSLNFEQVALALNAGKATALTMVGIALIIGGAAFKLGAFPFQAWIPDVYQGAPTPTTTFLGTASKAAGAFILFILVTGPLQPLAGKLAPLLAVASILTLLVGNLAALAATDIKRIIALSGVSHAGFILAAITAMLVAGDSDGYNRNLLSYYLLAYIAGSYLTAQALVSIPVAEDHRRPLLGLRGMLRRSPVIASALGFGISSLAGIPPSIGFFAKLFVLILLVKLKLWWIFGAALVSVALSIHYYFAILREAVVRPTLDQEEVAVIEVSPTAQFIIGTLSAVTVLGGLLFFL